MALIMRARKNNQFQHNHRNEFTNTYHKKSNKLDYNGTTTSSVGNLHNETGHGLKNEIKYCYTMKNVKIKLR